MNKLDIRLNNATKTKQKRGTRLIYLNLNTAFLPFDCVLMIKKTLKKLEWTLWNWLSLFDIKHFKQVYSTLKFLRINCLFFLTKKKQDAIRLNKVCFAKYFV